MQLELACLTPLIKIENSLIADRIGVENGEKTSFFKIARNLDRMTDFIDSIQSKNPSTWNSADSAFYNIVQKLNNIVHIVFIHWKKRNHRSQSDSALFKSS